MRVDFDWSLKDPALINDAYNAIFEERRARLVRIRAAGTWELLKAYYRDGHIADFIEDWGITIDPRRPEVGLPAMVPFVLFPKQREFLDYLYDHWKSRRRGLADKSRDGGLSWLAVGFGAAMCILNDGIVGGYGSRKEEYVDNSKDAKSLFYKAREFVAHLPKELRGGWVRNRDSSHMFMGFPETGSMMVGEAGKSIGRGNRTSFYFVDEAAFLEQPLAVDAALSQTTNCRIDISTPNGMANPFAVRRHSGKIDVFTLHWRDDPRKDDAWYQKQCEELDDPVVIAQEIDLDYSASVEGVLIPAAWIRAAVDAHVKLKIEITGERWASLDIADEGPDKNALCGGHGILVEMVEEWSGKGSDLFKTTERAFDLCDENGYVRLRYDSDGMGVNVRGDARVINERRKEQGQTVIEIEAFRGSEGVFEPDKPYDSKRTDGDKTKAKNARLNKDMFMNRKAQSWWALRRRFYLTWRAVTKGVIDSHDDLISLSSAMTNLQKVISELAQPTYDKTGTGKIFVDKTPDGAKSPNCGDAVMIRHAPGAARKMKISARALEAA